MNVGELKNFIIGELFGGVVTLNLEIKKSTNAVQTKC